jgi:hypothetical protein
VQQSGARYTVVKAQSFTTEIKPVKQSGARFTAMKAQSFMAVMIRKAVDC